MKSFPDVADLAEQYLAAWNATDVDAIVALHSADSRFQVHAGAPAVEGLDALRAAFADVFVRYPGFTAEVHRVLYGDRHWVLDWTLTFQPTGEERRGFHCLDVVDIDEAGLVARKDTFVNHAQQAAAMGAAA